MDDVRRRSDDDFLKGLAPQLAAIEEQRLSFLQSYRLRRAVAVAGIPLVVAFAIFLGFFILEDGVQVALAIVVLGGAVILYWVGAPKRLYAALYKLEILPRIASAFGLVYDPAQIISPNILKLSRIVPSYDAYNSDDYFRGTYSNTSVHFSDMTLTRREGHGKNKRDVIVFHGLVVFVQLPQPRFSGHTIMVGNSHKAARWLRQMLTGLQRADMVDPEFEKIFDVYTSDQTEARYLIHPAMIERFKAMRGEQRARGMMAAYWENNVLLLFHTGRNHFEPAQLHVSATDLATLAELKQEVAQVLDVIDRLDQMR